MHHNIELSDSQIKQIRKDLIKQYGNDEGLPIDEIIEFLRENYEN